jgi:TatD DNase family protein
MFFLSRDVSVKNSELEMSFEPAELECATDAHCHIIETPSTITQIGRCRTQKLFLMATKASDWDKIASVWRMHPNRILPFYGIHPWNVPSVETLNSDLQSLEAALINNPEAMVGEIGLDSVAKDPLTKLIYNQIDQFILFSKQFEIAAKFQRAVSMHNVKTHGKILQFFQKLDGDYLKLIRDKSNLDNQTLVPPAIMLHSYSGSIELCKSLLNLKGIGSKFYFSYSFLVNSRSAKSKDVISATPENRILIESDAHDINGVDAVMIKVITLVSEAKGWTHSQVIDTTFRNSSNFLHSAKSCQKILTSRNESLF